MCAHYTATNTHTHHTPAPHHNHHSTPHYNLITHTHVCGFDTKFICTSPTNWLYTGDNHTLTHKHNTPIFQIHIFHTCAWHPHIFTYGIHTIHAHICHCILSHIIQNTCTPHIPQSPKCVYQHMQRSYYDEHIMHAYNATPNHICMPHIGFNSTITPHTHWCSQTNTTNLIHTHTHIMHTTTLTKHTCTQHYMSFNCLTTDTHSHTHHNHTTAHKIIPLHTILH